MTQDASIAEARAQAREEKMRLGACRYRQVVLGRNLLPVGTCHTSCTVRRHQVGGCQLSDAATTAFSSWLSKQAAMA